jgi:hypothetical protein
MRVTSDPPRCHASKIIDLPLDGAWAKRRLPYERIPVLVTPSRIVIALRVAEAAVDTTRLARVACSAVTAQVAGLECQVRMRPPRLDVVDM